MKMKLSRALALMAIFSTPVFCMAQDQEVLNELGYRPDDVENTTPSYVPQVFGAVKAKFEVSAYDGKHRFNVRNSRIGVKGNIGWHMNYAAQIDFSNEGKIAVLDAYAGFVFDNFMFSIGQQQYKFSADLDRGPNTNIFANRSFLSKFLTTYYGEHDGRNFVGSIGSRDLGATMRYIFRTITPFSIQVGAFNGSGTNNPDWADNINVVARVSIGDEDHGFGGALSHYNGKTPEMTRSVVVGSEAITQPYKQRIRMWGGELRYAGEDFRIEAEYAQRRLQDKEQGLKRLHATHIQGYYQFRLLKKPLKMDYIAPVARWDAGKNIEYLNTLNSNIGRFSAHRATVGVNFGFVRKIVGSEVRLNYEKYFFGTKPGDYKVNPLLQDKFTLEVVATF